MPPSSVHFNGSVNLPDAETVMREISSRIPAGVRRMTDGEIGERGHWINFQIQKFLASHPFRHFHPRTPVIVAGDFNDVWGTLGPKYLLPAGFRGLPKPIRTYPAWAPFMPLDSVYVRGDVELLHVHRPHQQIARAASDHLPLFAELKLG